MRPEVGHEQARRLSEAYRSRKQTSFSKGESTTDTYSRRSSRRGCTCGGISLAVNGRYSTSNEPRYRNKRPQRIRSGAQGLYEGPVAFTFPQLFSGVADSCEWFDDRREKHCIDVRVTNRTWARRRSRSSSRCTSPAPGQSRRRSSARKRRSAATIPARAVRGRSTRSATARRRSEPRAQTTHGGFVVRILHRRECD